MEFCGCIGIQAPSDLVGAGAHYWWGDDSLSRKNDVKPECVSVEIKILTNTPKLLHEKHKCSQFSYLIELL